MIYFSYAQYDVGNYCFGGEETAAARRQKWLAFIWGLFSLGLRLAHQEDWGGSFGAAAPHIRNKTHLARKRAGRRRRGKGEEREGKGRLEGVAEEGAEGGADLGDELEAAGFGEADFCADGDEVVQGGVARAVDGGGVFAVVAFGAERQVICGGKSPLPAASGRFPDVEAEILAVVVLVVGQVVEYHSAIHFLDIRLALGYEACQGEEVGVVENRLVEGDSEQRPGSRGMEPTPLVVNVETTGGEVSAVYQFEVRYVDTARTSGIVI